MASPEDIAAVRAVILRDLDNFVNQYVPWLMRQQALDGMPTVAQRCATDAVVALDTHRAQHSQG